MAFSRIFVQHNRVPLFNMTEYSAVIPGSQRDTCERLLHFSDTRRIHTTPWDATRQPPGRIR
jgi:hypothetical protein